MSSAIAGLYGQYTQKKDYQYKARSAMLQAEQARIEAKGQKNAAYAQARGIEETDRKNAELRGQQMRQVRKQQRAAAGAADAAMATSGFSVSEGTGSAGHKAAWEQFDEAISNMAMSSSITSTNALQEAIDMRKSGDSAERMGEVNAIGYEAQANAYTEAAKATKRAMITGAIEAGVGAIVGGIGFGVMGALNGANIGWSLATGAGGWSNANSYYDNGLGRMAAYMTSNDYNKTLGWTNQGTYYSGFAGRVRS